MKTRDCSEYNFDVINEVYELDGEEIGDPVESYTLAYEHFRNSIGCVQDVDTKDNT